MSHNPKTARLSTAGRAMFTPCAPPAEREIVIISDDEEMATPTPTPTPTPVAVPVYPVVATPEESTATSPTPAPSLAAPVEDEEIGWKCKYYFKLAPETAYYHTLLTHVLDDYFPDLHASISYHYTKYKHPLEATFWKVELVVTAWNDIINGHEVETVHSAPARRAHALDGMEDAAQNAYIHYHGRRFEAMREDSFRFLSRNDHEGVWQVLALPENDPTLEATVQHVHAMQGVDDEVKGELRASQRVQRRLQKQVDELRAQLGQPSIYKKKRHSFTMIDTAP
ncbi:uncharacterized protein [Miscanthus floridulus]|uniref:uncharacterized protein n=1 Tax=Miscanthus floridulus TaxID=154761 RepID=UPI003457DD0E